MQTRQNGCGSSPQAVYTTMTHRRQLPGSPTTTSPNYRIVLSPSLDQTLYLGVGDMLRCYNPDENRLDPIMVHHREVRGRFTALAIDKTGDVWAGTKTDGLIHLNRTRTVVTRYRANSHMQDWLLSNHISALYYSPDEDVLWIGSSNRGVCCYHIAQKRFEVIAELFRHPHYRLLRRYVTIWLVGTTQGLYIYSPHRSYR